MNAWWMAMFIITATEGQAYNQPTLCLSATWNPVAITVAQNTSVGGYPNTIFVDQSNSIYLTMSALNHIEFWREGNSSQRASIANSLNQSQGLVVSSTREIYVDNGINRGRVERWTWSTSNATSVMNITASCYGLFLGPNDTLYCSLSTLHQVVSRSLRTPGTTPTLAAGSGVGGALPSMLRTPTGIFVDSRSNLYIADFDNHRIQLFPPGQVNGTTVAGNDTPASLVLSGPIGIMLDADDYLFILEGRGGRILRVGKSQYQCIAACTSPGNGPRQLNGPSSFQFDNQGNLLVVDRNTIRIQKFLLATNSCGPAYNLPRFSSCATWNPNGITFANTSTTGSLTLGIFVDTNNSLYAAARSLRRIQVWPEGSAVPNRSIPANLNFSRSIFVTINGDIFADYGSSPNHVYKWSANSTTSVIAMNTPTSCYGLFVDVKENLYCSLQESHYVMRKSLMDPINTVTIVAGNGTAGSALNQLNGPRGLVVDLDLNLYVADCFNNRVVRLPRNQLNGTVVVGSGASGTIDLLCPASLVIDADGYLFISDYSTNRIVGSGPSGFRCLVGCTGVNGSAADQLSSPYALSFDSHGNLFVADRDNSRIQQFLLARNSCSLSYNQPIFCPNAAWNPLGITLMSSNALGSGYPSAFVDLNDTMYVALTSLQKVQIWFAGSPTINGILLTSSDAPYSIFAAINGDVFVDNGAHSGRVDRWTQNSSTAITAMLVNSSCWGLFIDTLDQLYCSQPAQSRVIRRSLWANLNQTETVAGNGTNGSAANMFNGPRGIFVDLNLTLYVADCFNDRVQMFRAGEEYGTTIVGQGALGTVILSRPISIVMDGSGYLFIADATSIRIVTSRSNSSRCILGCGTGMSPINYPRTAHFDSRGNLVVMDSGNSRVQKFFLATNSCDESTTSLPVTQISMIYTSNPSSLVVTGPSSFLPSLCANSNTTGSFCNISNTPCDVLQPCLNDGTCTNTNETKYGYICQCSSHFNGTECQRDYQPCLAETCWNQGICQSTGNQSFLCLCVNGWEGDHCERQVNLCRNVRCSNGGVCRSSFLNYTCECLDPSYSGRHCEITGSDRILRERLSKSFAYVAIIAMVTLALLIVTLDVLKYGFGIDPAKEELERMQQKKMKVKLKQRTVVEAIRYLYVHRRRRPFGQ